MPLSEPRIVTRVPQPYAAIRLAVPQAQIAEAAPPLIGEVAGWVGLNARPAGPPFFNYTAMPPGGPVEMEVGLPIEADVAAAGRLMVDTLPGGRYASLVWTGPYEGLGEAHEHLHSWLGAQSLEPARTDGKLTVLEIYHSDPAAVPDPESRVTEIAVRLRDP